MTRSAQESPVPETGPPGLRWRGLETAYGEPTRARSWKRRIQPRGAYGALRQSSCSPVPPDDEGLALETSFREPRRPLLRPPALQATRLAGLDVVVALLELPRDLRLRACVLELLERTTEVVAGSQEDDCVRAAQPPSASTFRAHSASRSACATCSPGNSAIGYRSRVQGSYAATARPRADHDLLRICRLHRCDGGSGGDAPPPPHLDGPAERLGRSSWRRD